MKRLRAFLNRLAYRFLPDVRKAFSDSEGVATANRALTEASREAAERERLYREEYFERLAMLAEARLMAGSGPWRTSEKLLAQTDQLISAGVEALRSGDKKLLRETVTPITAQGAFGDIELALQNVEWRREINLSWLEFSRWGIQQIILISRLFYVKNPMIQRGVNIASYYVFGRGCEVTSDDDAANDVWQEFQEDNKAILGQLGLIELEKRLFYDGQVFFAFFPDKTDSGKTKLRTIDATEIQDIITDPDDTDQPWFYHRMWTARTMDPTSGQVGTQDVEEWYPALGYNPTVKMPEINNKKVNWDTPVYHMKAAVGVSKWHFHVPRVYAAIDWAKASTKFLESCLTIRKALSQIAMTLTTKGGQQAMEGAKQQLQTHVNSQPGNALWDTNPTAVTGSIFASGPGTTLAAFNTKGAGGDPEEVRQFKLMVCMVLDIPETFLADMNTSNLATAQTLDRPTELGFIAKQEAWRETLLVIAKYVLNTSKGATSGKLQEAKRGRYRIIETRRVVNSKGQFVYEANPQKKADTIQLRVNFPAIREGDMAANIKAIVEAMTLDNKGGQVVGIDERAGVLKMLEELGIDDPGELVETMYPEGEYDPDRTKEPLPAPIMKALPSPGGAPQNPDGQQAAPTTAPPPGQKEAFLLRRALRVLERLEAKEREAKAVIRKVHRNQDGQIEYIEELNGTVS